jgi:succinoglycan biosynthesis transport protein ExoP
MDVRDLGAALWRQKLLVLVILVIAGAGVTAGLWLAPKTYTATASVVTRQDPASQDTPAELDALRATLAELANSRAVVESVQARLLAEDGVERSLTELVSSIDGEWVENTLLVRVIVEDRDADASAAIANLVVEELVELPAPDDAFELGIGRPAVPPDTFSDPDLRVVLPLSVLAALLLAAVAALLRDRWANTVDDAADAEAAAVAPLLAHLAPPVDPTALPALHPGTAAADRFRHLRMALEAEARSGPSKKIVVAGMTSGDSTVWVAANVAIALARVGRRVLLVDGRMGDRFGRPVQDEPDTPGLYDVLSGAPLEEALSPGPVELLSVLPSGNRGAEPVERLVKNRFEAAMARAAEAFDVVVVLAPPLDVCDHARLMAVGGSLVLAVPQGGVSNARLRSQADKIRAFGARVLGVVLIGRRAEPTAA